MSVRWRTAARELTGSQDFLDAVQAWAEHDPKHAIKADKAALIAWQMADWFFDKRGYFDQTIEQMAQELPFAVDAHNVNAIVSMGIWVVTKKGVKGRVQQYGPGPLLRKFDPEAKNDSMGDAPQDIGVPDSLGKRADSLGKIVDSMGKQADSMGDDPQTPQGYHRVTETTTTAHASETVGSKPTEPVGGGGDFDDEPIAIKAALADAVVALAVKTSTENGRAVRIKERFAVPVRAAFEERWSALSIEQRWRHHIMDGHQLVQALYGLAGIAKGKRDSRDRSPRRADAWQHELFGGVRPDHPLLALRERSQQEGRDRWAYREGVVPEIRHDPWDELAEQIINIAPEAEQQILRETFSSQGRDRFLADHWKPWERTDPLIQITDQTKDHTNRTRKEG